MEFFPDLCEHTGLNDRAGHGHVRIQVPDVVEIRLAFQHSHNRADDPLKRRIGHCQNHITRHKERARNRQRDVAEIVHHPSCHVEARKVGRTSANDACPVSDFRLVWPPSAPFRGIIGRPPTQHRHVMRGGKRVHDGVRHLRGRRSIRREIEIEQQDSHKRIVQSSVAALAQSPGNFRQAF